jgi:hypothetical protein
MWLVGRLAKDRETLAAALQMTIECVNELLWPVLAEPIGRTPVLDELREAPAWSTERPGISRS